MVSHKQIGGIMEDLRYYGTYARFDTESKKDAAPLLGADSIVGDAFTIEIQREDRRPAAWIVNKFGSKVGKLDPKVSRELGICRARGWTMRAFLSFVAFTDTPEPGFYWGEVALICNDSHYDEAFDEFSRHVSQLMADSVRPEVELSASGIDQVISSQGTWMTETRRPLPEKSRGTVILKKHQKFSEKMIEQGRKGNKGCYIVSWAFLLALGALVLFGLKSCGVF